jgi:hypothetical protein
MVNIIHHQNENNIIPIETILVILEMDIGVLSSHAYPFLSLETIRNINQHQK